MNPHQLCLVVAAICFGVGAANVPGLNWLCAGLVFGTLSLLI